MRLAVFGPQRRVGIVDGHRVIDACAAYASYLRDRRDEASPEELAAATVPAELGEFIRAGDRAIAAAQVAVDHLAAGQGEDDEGRARLSWELGAVKLHAPLARRARMFLAGNNYASHAAGVEGAPDAAPAAIQGVRNKIRSAGLRGFISFGETCIGTGEGIVYPARTDMLDFEGEVAIVIGRECKDVSAAVAPELIWGYMLLNDLSARRALPVDDNPASRFARDKNFDTGKAAGPFVAVGEFADAQDIRWETRINGELRQSGHTADMVFTFAEMVEHLSSDMTLYPGDVISGGTPSGTGLDSAPTLPDGGRDPSAFLHVGDVIELSSAVLGTLRNTVVEKVPR